MEQMLRSSVHGRRGMERGFEGKKRGKKEENIFKMRKKRKSKSREEGLRRD